MIEAPTSAGAAQAAALKLFANADEIIRGAFTTGSVDIPAADPDMYVTVDRAGAIEYARHLRETAIGFLQWGRLMHDHENSRRVGAPTRGTW